LQLAEVALFTINKVLIPGADFPLQIVKDNLGVCMRVCVCACVFVYVCVGVSVFVNKERESARENEVMGLCADFLSSLFFASSYFFHFFSQPLFFFFFFFPRFSRSFLGLWGGYD